MEQTQGNGNDGQRHLNIASGFSVEKVEKFCYLGDTVHADGGADEAVVARIRKGWSNFKELLPFLTDKYITLAVRGKVYEACVRNAMLYGSETWAVRKSDVGGRT